VPKIASFPDVCVTPSPAGPVPIPYPNIGLAGKQGLQTKGFSGSAVKDLMAGKVPSNAADKLLLANKIKPSMGDAAGAAKAAVSQKVMGPAKLMMGAGKVLFMG
jgi:hypothetical protein